MRRFVFLIFVWMGTLPAFAQCEVPRSRVVVGPNIFSTQQETDLGDIVGDEIRHQTHFISDASLNRYLDALGQHLAKKLPDSPYKYRFQLIDEPYANAFATPGGRIYVTRQAALLAKDEDELSGLLAHEMGHVYTRQIAVDYTQTMKDVLNVTSVGDRADITRKFHQLLDLRRKKHTKYRRNHSDQQQLEADQVAVYTMTLAGYRPSAFGDYFDRLSENEGKTGGFWSDLFGTTPAESKRLRAILQSATALQTDCAGTPEKQPGEFANWQQQLLEWSGAAEQDEIHNVVFRTKLQPPLFSDMNRIRFSPDGRYILAQDDATVSILTRAPFAYLFRVELPNRVLPATFSPDSRMLIVANEAGRVEKWDLIEMRRKAVRQVPITKGCGQTRFSSDGDFMGCLEYDGTLTLMETATGKKLYEKKEFYRMTFYDYLAYIMSLVAGQSFQPPVHMEFSPDVHYFAAGAHETALAIDLTNNSTISLKGNLQSRMGRWFTFAGPDRVVTRDSYSIQQSYLQEFPSGKQVMSYVTGAGYLTPVTKGAMASIAPVKDFKFGVIDMTTGKPVSAMKSSGFDMYGDWYVSESRTGVIVLGEYKTMWDTNLHYVQLPAPELGNVQVASVSDDAKWLAISENSRGGVFNLQNGMRVTHLRGFKGAWFSPDQKMWADFPKFEQIERSLVTVDTNTSQVDVKHEMKDEMSSQRGPYMVVFKDKKSYTREIEVHDVQTDKVLWTRTLKGITADANWVNGTIVLSSKASSRDAKEAAASDAALSQKLSQLKQREASRYFEVLDLATGKPIGSVVWDTNKFSDLIGAANATHDYLFATDLEGRLRVVQIATGEEVTTMFGQHADISSTGLLAVQLDAHRIQIYDLATMEKIDEYAFSSSVAYLQFLKNGKRLLVVTRDQNVIVAEPAGS